MKHLWKLLLSIFIIYVMNYAALAQVNLVPNPSFEDTIHCPNSSGEILLAKHWISATLGSPDYYNSCSSNYNSSLPSNWYGTQNAHFGSAYVGIYTYTLNNNYREYFECQLNDSLLANKRYLVQFWASLADTSDFACNSIGAYLSNQQITFPSLQQNLPYFPQAKNYQSNLLTSKLIWTLISDTIIANGGEKYLTIGNFEPDSSSLAINVGGSTFDVAYYYFDDIKVLQLDSTTSIDDKTQISFSLFPNPFLEEVNIIPHSLLKKGIFKVVLNDICGREITCYNFETENEMKLNLRYLEKGVYIIRIITKNQILFSTKIIKF